MDTHADYSLLTVDPVKKENSGNYTCTVTNRFGSDSHTTGFETKGMYVKFYYCSYCRFEILVIL